MGLIANVIQKSKTKNQKSAPSVTEPLSGTTTQVMPPRLHAPVTIFALPKPFAGNAAKSTAIAQSNAIESWKRLRPAIDIVLIGDEPGIADYATRASVAHVTEVQRNAHGTPLVSSAFATAHQATTSPVLVYCNADVILNHDFVQSIEQLAGRNSLTNFLAIGQRTDLDVGRAIDFSKQSEVDELFAAARSQGKRSSAVCKEYFVFNRELFAELPDFAVGRGNWDNWIVAHARANRIPVVDLSEQVLAIHQRHDYAHFSGSRMQCYVSGPEARENQRLAGGRNLIRGATCTHRLTKSGVAPLGTLRTIWNFLRDVPRFASLMCKLLVQR